MKKILFFFIFLSHLVLASAQSYTVSGVVISEEDNLPLPGAGVQIKGTTNGTMTDEDGRFTLKANKGAILTVTFIGFQTYEKTITANASSLRIILKSDSQILDEVVAIGYGSVKKSDLTGAVASISGKDLLRTPASGLDKALQGLTPGVTVVSNSGQPGSEAVIRIRGIGTVNSDCSPIYVVDGVICSNINFLSPHDVKSIEVLKDASSSAIYGSRGANGVIIVTTKQGTKGDKVNLTADIYYGIQNRAKKLDIMNSKQLSEFWGYTPESGSFNDWVYNNFAGSKGQIPAGLNYASYDTDWQDAVFQNNAPVQNYYISADGATDKASYAISGGYYDQKGIILDSFYKRFTFRVNTSLKVNNWLKLGENLSLMTSSNRNALNNSDNSSLLNSAMRLAPWDPIYYPEGSRPAGSEEQKTYQNPLNVAASSIANYQNPMSMTGYSHPSDNWYRIVGNAYIEINPIKGLVFKSDFGVDMSFGESKLFKNQYEIAPYDRLQQNFVSHSMSRYTTWTNDNILTYTVDLKKHHLSAMAGISLFEARNVGVNSAGSNIPNAIEENWYVALAQESTKKGGDFAGREALASFLGRLIYSYDNRYFLTVNYRADGSTKFATKNLWGNFPSFSAAWKISEEQFFLPAKEYVNSLKLRAGWGRLGNEKIPGGNFYAKAQTGSQFVSYVFGPGDQMLAGGAMMLSLPIEGLRWEMTETWNVGLDFGLFNNRLQGTMDYYIRDTKDMLLNVQLPSHIGMQFTSPDNVGEVRNQGFELSLDYKDRIGKLNYSIGGNLATVKNRFTKMGPSSPIYTGGFKGEDLTVSKQGEPLYSFYGYESAGIFQNEAEVNEYVQRNADGTPKLDANGDRIQIIPGLQPGDVKYVDRNGDGIISNLDKKMLGNSFPTFTYGFNIALDWNNFDVQLFFQGVTGNKIYNCNRVIIEGVDWKATNLSTNMLNSWHGEGTSTTMPRANGKASNFWASDRFIEDGSYFRLKNAQIGYTLPRNLTQKIGVDRCRFYVSGSNLFTVTKYTGYDPEASYSGIDRGNYPQAVTILFGLTLNL